MINATLGKAITSERLRAQPFVSFGVQLSVVTEKLTVVTDGAPEKGRRYHTFSHTERASLATIYLCTEYAVHIPSICYTTIKYLWYRTLE